MKKKSLNLKKLTLSKETIAELGSTQKHIVVGGGTNGCVTAGNSCPYTQRNVCQECVSFTCPPTLAPVTQPCGTQPCGGGTL